MSNIKKNKMFQPILGLGIQGRIKDAMSFVSSIKINGLSKKEKEFIVTFKKRFCDRNAKRYRCSNPLVKELINIYQEYWFQVLLKEKSTKQAERWLFAKISSFLRSNGIQFKKKFDDKYYCRRLKSIIESEGFKCITGTVEPFQELEIWEKETVKKHKVKLPESTETVKTTYLRNFVVKGWMDFATIGVFYPGGWAKKDGLYCNAGAYNLKSEKFLVSYLAHEAQHFADYKRYPKLEQIDLEYRAKLAELSRANRIHKKALYAFASQADRNRKSPHAFANHCVVRDISNQILGNEDLLSFKGFEKVSRDKVNIAATLLLQQHSTELKKKGARTARKLVN